MNNIPESDPARELAFEPDNLQERLSAAEAAVQSARWSDVVALAMPVLESVQAGPPLRLRAGESVLSAALVREDVALVERVLRMIVSLSVPGAIRRARSLVATVAAEGPARTKAIQTLDEAEGVGQAAGIEELRSRYSAPTTPQSVMAHLIAEAAEEDADEEEDPVSEPEDPNVVPISRYRKPEEPETQAGDIYDFEAYPQRPIDAPHLARSVHQPVKGREDDAEEGRRPEPLPLLEGSVPETPQDLHRFVVSNPGEPAREMLRRFAEYQAKHQDLNLQYDLGLAFLGSDQFDAAIPVLISVASTPNENQLGAAEALAQCFFHEGRLDEAYDYLVGVVPENSNDPSFAGLFYWLGMVSEERQEPANALTYYTHALRLDPSLIEAKRRARILLG